MKSPAPLNTLKKSMPEVLSSCQNLLFEEASSIQLKVMDPSPWINQEIHDGQSIGEDHLPFRSLKVWQELSEVLDCRMGVPKPEGGHLLLSLHPLPGELWRARNSDDSDVYDPLGHYGHIHKMEDPHWLRDYFLCLKQCSLGPNSKILSLGVNRGDELFVLKNWYPSTYDKFSFTGFDLSQKAIQSCHKAFPESKHRFEVRDISDDPPDELPQQDLLISLSTLQCSNIEGKEVFRRWFQKSLSPSASVILGFPNCSWLGGEVVYGARMRNQPHPDPSRLMKDLMYYRKYLQTHGKRVSITGKHHLFLVGSAI